MDRFRTKIVKQQTASAEEKKKRQHAMLTPNIISLILYIPMVVIGYQNLDACEMNAPLYLLIGGGIGLGMTLLKIIALLTPSDCDDKFINVLGPLASLFSFGVTIWGSFVVFGAYSRWSYNIKDANNNEDEFEYCPYTPFMMAFVLLILEWVLKPFMLVCECVMACLSCCKPSPAASTSEYTAAATSENDEKGKNIIKQQNEKC